MLVEQLEPVVPVVDAGLVGDLVLEDPLARSHVQLEVVGCHLDRPALLAAVELRDHFPGEE